jgi:branched-chain amino acid transport system substrate-binding protein
MKSFRLPGLTLALFLVTLSFLAGCASNAANPTQSSSALPSVMIGGPVSITGAYAKEGEQCIWGIQTGVKWVNDVNGGINLAGKKYLLEYKYYDDESKKEMVTSLTERVITTDKVKAVVSPYGSGLVLAGATVAEKYGMVYLNQGGASDRIHQQGFKYAVQVYVPATRYHVGALDMFHRIDPESKKLALCYEDEEFSQMVRQGTENYARSLGYNLVFNRSYPSKVNDLTPILSDLKASAPDIILGGGHFADTQLFCKQMSDLAINVKAVSLVVGPTLPAYYDALGPLAEGFMGPAHWEQGVKFSAELAKSAGVDWIGPSQDEFIQAFTKLSGGVAPDYHAAASTAVVLSLVKAMENAGSTESDKVRAELDKLRFMSVYGDWDIDSTGLQTGHTSVDVQWQSGKKEIIWPEGAAISKICYPKPTYEEIKSGKMAVPPK